MSKQGFQQVQDQRQTLVLAPQLRQSLKILQVPALELRNAILQELETNPCLDELPMDGISIEEKTSDPEEEKFDEKGEELDFEENYELLNRLDEDSREYYAQENGNSYTSEDAERRQHMFDSFTSEISLQEHLLEQARMTEQSPDIIEGLEYLIGSLDDRGFLSSELSDVGLMSGQPLKIIQDAYEVLRSLDPPGIGAKDTRDCLLMQLNQQGEGDNVAARILREHYDLLLRRRIPEISKKMSVTINDVERAIIDIGNLDPAPGRKFADDSNSVVEPDVRVEQDDNGDWIVILNNDYIPRLRVNTNYKQLIAQGKLKGKEREYLQDKIRSGKFLMSSIEQRQQTIERITRELLKYQAEFFENGVSRLKPLTMSQIADEVGVHETTISRAIANKYIETPHGVFSFKFFFTSGYTTHDGESVANTSIKERIRDIIEAEDTAKPLSDNKIAQLLANEDIKIARRTVAKYREELGILPTNLRRQYK